MNLKKEIERRIGPLLSREGFVRHPGPWLSYIRKKPDIHYHVNFENHSYANALSVSLQTVDRYGNRKGIELSDFNDGCDYEYRGISDTVTDRTSCLPDSDEISDVVKLIADDLKNYGIPWLNSIEAR